MKAVAKYEPQDVLEVGNVLPHYHPYLHIVVDKYERDNGAMNVDITDVRFLDKFNLIVSISTIEHVGWDETPRQPGKMKDAIANMRRLLAPGGKLVVTLPIGYNPHVDSFLLSGSVRFANEYFMRRTSKDNRWEECLKEDSLKAEYDYPYKFANAIMIGIDGGTL
jgi:SAM-dependent methyltransferase